MTLSVVVAGGGTAGHVEPALALADAVRRLCPDAVVTALGTATGLEATLVPARGYPLAEIPRVPLPRRPTPALLSIPWRVRGAVRETRAHLERVRADVVVGFGGYVALPAYLAARGRVPIVVHEANARAGLANRLGARLTPYVAVAVPGSGLKGATVVGIPLRRAIADLDRVALRDAARSALGLDVDGPVLLVTGGSQGAQRVNAAVVGAARELSAAGVQVLHVAGPKNVASVVADVDGVSGYHVLAYADRMELAYAAADLVLCRAGAMTCAELSAVGLPAVFVPLAIGNGEQALNARPIVEAGGGLLVEDAEMDAARVRAEVLTLLRDPARLTRMAAATARLGHREADVDLARMVLAAATSGAAQ